MSPAEEHRPDLPSRGTSPDPYLRAFLRQAVAVIAAERGFNDASGAKLHVLAKQLGLTEQAFHEAIEKLKQPSSSLGLNRYERQFVEYLTSELRKLKGDVLTIKYEQRVIDLAENKYQMDPVRAQQLLQKTAQQQQVGMISHSDAQHYAKHLIAEAAGHDLSIANQEQDRLYRACKKLGLEQWEVDQALQELFLQNRWLRQKSRAVMLVGSVAVLSIVAAITGLAVNWESMTATGNQNQHVAGQPTIALATEPTGMDWWNPELETAVNTLRQQDLTRSLLDRLFAPTPADRQTTYAELTAFLCESSSPPPALTTFLAQAFWHEPDSPSAMAILQNLRPRLMIDQHVMFTARKIREASRANRVLADICHAKPSPLETTDDRKQEFQQTLNQIFNTRIELGSADVFLQQTEPILWAGFWTHALTSCKAQPDRVAAFVPELENDVRSANDLAINELRTKTLLTVLSQQAFHWEALQVSIERSIERSDRVKLIAWINLQSETHNRGLAEFLYGRLIHRLELDPTKLDRDAILAAFREYRLEVENPGYRNIAAADASLQQKIKVATETNHFSTKFSSEEILGLPSAALPKKIKSAAELNNLLLAWIWATERAVIDFELFDAIANKYMQDANPASIRVDRPQTRVATASELRALQAALKKIFDSEPALVAARLTALRKLRDLAERFDHLSYDSAQQLAQYILSEKDVRESLMVESVLPRLAHWPELKLALADQIISTQRDIDFVQEIVTRLKIANRNESSSGTWSIDLQRTILEQVLLDLKPSNPISVSHTNGPWNQLRSELQDVYSDRLSCVSTEPIPRASRSLTELSLRVNDQLASRDPTIGQQIGLAGKLIRQSGGSEMAQLAVIQQFQAEYWLAQLAADSRHGQTPESSNAEKIFADYQSLVATGDLNHGQWLLCSERLLGQVLHQYQMKVRKGFHHE